MTGAGTGPVGWDVLLRPDHLFVLADDTGIVQHANGAVPNRSTGYCVDDVARMALVAAQMHHLWPDAALRRLVALGLAFLVDATDPGAGMRNFMAYDRTWLDEPHVGDHVGRTVWALGVVDELAGEPALTGPAHRLLHELLPVVDRFDTLHEDVYAVLGLARTATCDDCRRALAGCADRLLARWDASAGDGWPWPEGVLTYDNARTPQALLLAGAALAGHPRRDDLLRAGERSLDWFCDLSGATRGEVATIGNLWLRQGDQVPAFTGDEQPIDAGALVELQLAAAEVLQRPELGSSAVASFGWFLGANRLGLSLYDPQTSGCRDGLGREAVNENQGAESTLAFQQAALALALAGCPCPTSDGVAGPPR